MQRNIVVLTNFETKVFKFQSEERIPLHFADDLGTKFSILVACWRFLNQVSWLQLSLKRITLSLLNFRRHFVIVIVTKLYLKHAFHFWGPVQILSRASCDIEIRPLLPLFIPADLKIKSNSTGSLAMAIVVSVTCFQSTRPICALVNFGTLRTGSRLNRYSHVGMNLFHIWSTLVGLHSSMADV